LVPLNIGADQHLIRPIVSGSILGAYVPDRVIWKRGTFRSRPHRHYHAQYSHPIMGMVCSYTLMFRSLHSHAGPGCSDNIFGGPPRFTNLDTSEIYTS
jgi:hypothetical protein